ncbi:Uncharacterized protein BP5553_00988 [Venustampulla echinocandica]|uniref:Uncharacterized protein n=1 Tax=Venustampulla echinocandica TaxID=2656787 RepID=A0A370TZP8_9HELO|nr:Uncharacterized protein BP5553_00988 [Venustampulla echinocandica]RDL41009.1 Uncharacterized protein BP5553_00988 [Venustampulla echinocandica]
MPNLSIFAIPAYWVLSMAPHAYAIGLIKKANNGRWDNTNPRSSNWDDTLRKSTPAEVYGRFTRAEAAHNNGLENLPLFVGAILAANLAKLSTRDVNTFAAAYLGLRVVYTLLYINVTRNRSSFWRTGIWIEEKEGDMGYRDVCIVELGKATRGLIGVVGQAEKTEFFCSEVPRGT